MAEPNARGATVGIDTSVLDPQMRYELHRRLSLAKVPFRQVRDELVVPSHRLAWTMELMNDVAADAVEGADDLDEEVDSLGPVRPYPYARIALGGVGEPASRLQRLGGYLVDQSIFVVPARAAVKFDLPVWVAGVAVVVQAVVVVSMVALRGTSPGKLAVDTRVVPMDPDSGTRVSWGRSALRWIVQSGGAALVFVAPVALRPSVAFTATLLFLLSAGFVLFGADGRAVHDLAAGTIVVRADGIEPVRR